MTNWEKILADAMEIRKRFIDTLSEEHEPEAILAGALSVIYETQEIFDEDFTTDFSTHSALGQFLLEHANEKVSVERVHGVVIFIASRGETIEVTPPIEVIERLRYIA